MTNKKTINSVKIDLNRIDDLKSNPPERGEISSPLTHHIQSVFINNEMAIENERLKKAISEFERYKPIKLINPDQIVYSKFANRLEASFLSEDFSLLKDKISKCGGNVQPIKVRQKIDSLGALDKDQDGNQLYEIVYGHRRHRACKELGISVLCIIDNISDQQLFMELMLS